MAISYDAASRITAIGDATNPAAAHTYGYDELDRLTSVVTPTLGQMFPLRGCRNFRFILQAVQ